MSRTTDIAIVGAGMVGAALARTLAGCGVKITLFDSYPLPAESASAQQPSFDARATALSEGSRRILDQLGVWGSMAELAAPIRTIQVSDRGHFGMTRLSAEAQGVAALGYVVENRIMGQALLSGLAEQADLQIRAPAEVVDAEFGRDAVCVHWRDDAAQPQSLRAKLLLVADGGRSTLCERLQLRQRSRDYQQCALIANLGLDRAHQGRAFERFTAEGPMALLPLTAPVPEQHRAALVWSVPAAAIDELLALPADAFIARFHQAFGYRAGCVTQLGERHAYPLKLSQVTESLRSRLLVLGNAAHTLHPIAGQGFNLSLRDLTAFASVLRHAVQGGEDIGTLAVLERYQRAQAEDQQRVIGFSDLATRLFSNNQPGAVCLRNLGLLVLDLLPMAQQPFARAAMGVDRPLEMSDG